MVAPKGDDVRVLGLKADDLRDDLADAVAAVDQVAEEDELVGREVPGDVPFELLELAVSAVNVADHVRAHGIYDLAVQGRRSGAGWCFWIALSESLPETPIIKAHVVTEKK